MRRACDVDDLEARLAIGDKHQVTAHANVACKSGSVYSGNQRRGTGVRNVDDVEAGSARCEISAGPHQLHIIRLPGEVQGCDDVGSNSVADIDNSQADAADRDVREVAADVDASAAAAQADRRQRDWRKGMNCTVAVGAEATGSGGNSARASDAGEYSSFGTAEVTNAQVARAVVHSCA